MSRKLIRVFSSALMVLFDHIFHFSKRLPISSNTRYWLAIDHPSDIPIYTKGELKVPPRKKKLHKKKSPFGNITWSFWWMYQKMSKMEVFDLTCIFDQNAQFRNWPFFFSKIPQNFEIEWIIIFQNWSKKLILGKNWFKLIELWWCIRSGCNIYTTP